MKLSTESQNREALEAVRGKGNILRNYRSVGLHRGWEDVLVSSIDREVEWILNPKEDKRRRPAKLKKAPKPAA